MGGGKSYDFGLGCVTGIPASHTRPKAQDMGLCLHNHHTRYIYKGFAAHLRSNIEEHDVS